MPLLARDFESRASTNSAIPAGEAELYRLNLDDFDYTLPPGLIAQVPARSRTASRLLHLDGATGALRDLQFRDIVDHVSPGDLVVLNDTRVIKARLSGRKKSGGRVEAL